MVWGTADGSHRVHAVVQGGWALPRWWVDIAGAIHFYEAILAVLAIAVWHFYHVIFDPDVYPIDLAFWDGKVAEERYKEHHPLAYEQMFGETEAEEEKEPEAKPQRAQTGTAKRRRKVRFEPRPEETDAPRVRDPANKPA
jgi:hypothetical protein